MAITLLDHAADFGGTAGRFPDGPEIVLNCTGANFLVMQVCGDALTGAAMTPSDTETNTWVPFLSGNSPDWAVGSEATFMAYYCVDPTVSAAQTFKFTTANPGNPHAAMAVSAWDWPGVAAANYDVFDWQNTDGMTPVIDLGPLTVQVGLVFSSCGIALLDTSNVDGEPTVNSDFLALDYEPSDQVPGTESHCGLVSTYKILTAADVEAPIWTLSSTAVNASAGVWGFLGPTPPAPPTSTVYPIRRQHRFMLPWDEANRMKFLSRLELVMQTGIGDSTITNPTVMLRLSKDGGLTYGNEIEMQAGPIGAFDTRVFANRLGRGRNWVAEVTVSDPVKWQMLQCLADLEEGSS